MTDPLDRLSAALADKYRIERELGEGGMATVYLAADLKHDRQVAIKVLRPELAAVIGAERFLSEIKTTANLQHPHILPLFDSGEADSFLFYVMPYVEGETVRDRISREKQLPVADAVRITTEIAAALDYAHRHGVIHRDIKPENILLHDGSALVADFGIALAASKAGGTRMTETGMSLGTPHYMSPEQAMGDREITARSDVYALGCVAYEMLVGEPPFTGPTAQAIIARVMTEDPRTLAGQRRTIPPGVEAAVFTALEKLPADRFATAAEFAAALADPTTTTLRPGFQPAVTAKRRSWLVAGGLALVALVAGFLIGHRKTESGSVGSSEVVRANLAFGDSAAVQSIGNVRLAISPSGRRVVFVGSDGVDQQLWIRDLAQPTARPLPDTKGAFAPFFSSDGESVGFFTGAGGRTILRVIPATGGAARVVVNDSVANYGGGDWGDDGNIYFTNDARSLARVASTGGAVTVVASPDTAVGIKELDFPDVLPGSKYALVMLWKGSIGGNHVGVVDLTTGATTDIGPGSYARYMPPGFIAIGTSDSRILVAPFDLKNGTLTGTPVPVIQGVATDASNGTVQFAVSETGTLLYQQVANGGDALVWVDRSGETTPVDTTLRGLIQNLALSPDGTQIAVSTTESGEPEVWVKQLRTGAYSKLSFDVIGADRPVWTPDGRKVAFLATRDGRRTAWMRRADGSDSTRPASPGSTQLDEIWLDEAGRYTVLRSEGGGVGSRRLLVVENGIDTVPRTLIQSRFDHYSMVLSPNGRWLAYVSEESGAPEVYVRPFPNVDSARFAISVGGGIEPLWRRDGTELFFRTSRGGMFAVPVKTGAQFEHGIPQSLFSQPGLMQSIYHRGYDVHPDGNRFLMVSSFGGLSTKQLNIIFNWRAELEKLEQAPR
jgi:Tol biopolymer transport system component